MLLGIHASIPLAVGKQAEVLNILLEDVLQGHPVSDRKLKEVLGHTPVQVRPAEPLHSSLCHDFVCTEGPAALLLSLLPHLLLMRKALHKHDSFGISSSRGFEICHIKPQLRLNYSYTQRMPQKSLSLELTYGSVTSSAHLDMS